MSCSENSPNHQTGEERKLAAHVLLEVHREAYLRLARRTLLEVLFEYGTASIDDVRDLVKVPATINPKFFGAVPGHFARLNIISSQSMVKTRRKVAHARHVTLWRLTDIGKAKEWLRTHPALEFKEEKQREGGQ